MAEDAEQRARYAFLLRALRYTCIEAHDTRDAIVRAESESPNVILLDVANDVEMIRVCRRLKRVLDDRVPVLLALSRETAPPILQRVADSGAEDYVTRPVDEVDLIFKLRRMMRYALQFQALERRNAHLDGLLRRHVGGPLVDEWLRDAGSGEQLSGREVEVTTIFADINGFTRLSSEWPAARTVVVLNEILTLCTLPLVDYGATVDKYIGDCVMAYFGPAEDQPEHATRCVRAATGMQRALRQWAGHSSNLEHPMSLSIGINTGRAILGNMGSSLRLDHTVIGDAVNVASRIQDLAPTGAILAGPETVRQTADRFRWRSLGPRELRGRAEPVEVFELLDERYSEP